ncbi:MAG: VOC family protein [archaeon]
MKPQGNPVGWFEIPVVDMKKAIEFYETVFNIRLEEHKLGDLQMAWFPMVKGKEGATGSLVKHDEHYRPCNTGTLVYFTAHSGDLKNELGRVEDAGGKVMQEKTQLGENGFVAFVLDTEGNKIALHSMK